MKRIKCEIHFPDGTRIDQDFAGVPQVGHFLDLPEIASLVIQKVAWEVGDEGGLARPVLYVGPCDVVCYAARDTRDIKTTQEKCVILATLGIAALQLPTSSSKTTKGLAEIAVSHYFTPSEAVVKQLIAYEDKLDAKSLLSEIKKIANSIPEEDLGV